jgi:hypothetical protein
MSAYFADHEVPVGTGSSNLAGKHEGRESRMSGSHGPGGGGVDYTGGLQEGGPKRIENLVSVTSYPPNPAARAP